MIFSRPRLCALACTAALAFTAALPAHAANFNFSYTFTDGSLLAGSLSGDLVGQFIANVSNLQVSLDGNAFSGAHLYAAAWNTTTESWDNTTPALIATDGALNNFIIADSNVPSDFGTSNYVYFVNDPALLGKEVFANNLNTGDIALDNPTNGSWVLTAAAVPEPTSLALLLAGFGVVAIAAQRRAR